MNDQAGVFVILAAYCAFDLRPRGLAVGQCVKAAAPNTHCILVTTFERLIFQFGGQVG